MVFHWELEAFLREVALGLVEAEKKRERSSKTHTHAVEGQGGTTSHILSHRLGLLIPPA